MQNYIIILLFVTGVVFVSISWLKKDLSCPPPHIIYRYVQANILDTQFSSENLPSNVYNYMFNNNNLLVGGITATIQETNRKQIRNSVPFMSMITTPIPNQKYKGPITGPT